MYKFGRFLCWVYCAPFVRLTVSGKENVPKEGGFILASNHISYLDPPVLGFACPRNLNFMAKAELFCNPVFGKLISSVGAFPVKRKSGDISALKEAIKRLAAGKGLVLFPEGGRGNGSGLKQPEAGVGFIAVKSGVPVVPTFIKGTEIVLPKGSRKMRRAQVSVVFGKPVFLEKNKHYQDAANLIMDKIAHLSV